MKKIALRITTIILTLVIIFGVAFYFYNHFKTAESKAKSEKAINEITTLNFIKPDLSSEVKDRFQKDFNKQAQSFLEDKGKSAGSYWPLLSIGAIKQEAGDYQGAEQAWLLAAKLQPKAYPPYGNLGYLYFHYFKDFAKAETAYLQAIANDPEQLQYYVALHQIYRYFYKQDTNLAEEILLQGLEVQPDNIGLLEELARYYKDTNKKDQAVEIYQKVLTLDPKDELASQMLKQLK
ncbi:MAG: hypothetical protein WC508_05795 [Patescibacteria group bacterium]